MVTIDGRKPYLAKEMGKVYIAFDIKENGGKASYLIFIHWSLYDI